MCHFWLKQIDLKFRSGSFKEFTNVGPFSNKIISKISTRYRHNNHVKTFPRDSLMSGTVGIGSFHGFTRSKSWFLSFHRGPQLVGSLSRVLALGHALRSVSLKDVARMCTLSDAKTRAVRWRGRAGVRRSTLRWASGATLPLVANLRTFPRERNALLSEGRQRHYRAELAELRSRAEDPKLSWSLSVWQWRRRRRSGADVGAIRFGVARPTLGENSIGSGHGAIRRKLS